MPTFLDSARQRERRSSHLLSDAASDLAVPITVCTSNSYAVFRFSPDTVYSVTEPTSDQEPQDPPDSRYRTS